MLPTRVCAILYNMTDEPIRVPTGLTTEGLLGRRYLARAIDSMIIGALAGVVLSVLGGLGPHTGADLLSILLNLFALLIFWIGYAALLESSPWQATLGKRLMGYGFARIRFRGRASEGVPGCRAKSRQGWT